LSENFVLECKKKKKGKSQAAYTFKQIARTCVVIDKGLDGVLALYRHAEKLLLEAQCQGLALHADFLLLDLLVG
jgi:hypothetical protein